MASDGSENTNAPRNKLLEAVPGIRAVDDSNSLRVAEPIPAGVCPAILIRFRVRHCYSVTYSAHTELYTPSVLSGVRAFCPCGGEEKYVFICSLPRSSQYH